MSKINIFALGGLNEDGKNMYNMLKTKTLVVNNYVGDKKCDCYLF